MLKSSDPCNTAGTLTGPVSTWLKSTTVSLEISNELCRGLDYTFAFMDAWGDGLCCEYGPGSYYLVLEGTKVFTSTGKFEYSEETTIRVPEYPTFSPSSPPSKSPSSLYVSTSSPNLVYQPW